MEEAVRSAKGNKRLVLVLNKADLVPRENLDQWLKYLRASLPAVAFKSSTQSQSKRLGRKKLGRKTESMIQSNTCFGAELLLSLLGNYCRNSGNVKTKIRVGVVGLPNVGKSSVINSLKRSKACNVGNTPGISSFVRVFFLQHLPISSNARAIIDDIFYVYLLFPIVIINFVCKMQLQINSFCILFVYLFAGITKTMQAVQLDSKIKLLDSPGIVFASSDGSSDETSIALKNAVKIKALKDPFTPATAILKRISREQVMELYDMQDFSTPDEFFAKKAARMGKYRKGGIPNALAAARSILDDWNSGKIRFVAKLWILVQREISFRLIFNDVILGITRYHPNNRCAIYLRKLSVKWLKNSTLRVSPRRKE